MTLSQFIKSFSYSYIAFDLRDNSPVPEWVYDTIDNMRTGNYKLIESLRSLWYWLPIIWNDRHWDHIYIFVLLQHKLKGVETELLQDTFVGGLREAKKVRTAILLIDRILADDYDSANYNLEKRLIERDIDYLFKILSKHIQKWWT